MGFLLAVPTAMRRRRAPALTLVTTAIVLAMSMATTASATPSNVLGWGNNTYKPLGKANGTLPPSAVGGLEGEGVTAVAGGYEHSIALIGNGTVKDWGTGTFGQLGTGEAIDSLTPVAALGVTGATAVAAGEDFSMALLSNGTVKAWGANESGQLGTESEAAQSATPAQVSKVTTATAIAAGFKRGLALLSNGKVMQWGEGSNVPTLVSGLSEVKAIAANGGFGMCDRRQQLLQRPLLGKRHRHSCRRRECPGATQRQLGRRMGLRRVRTAWQREKR
jgi:hypothetical protein